MTSTVVFVSEKDQTPTTSCSSYLMFESMAPKSSKLASLECMLLIISPRPLHIAARSGMVRVVQELVRRGGNLSARDCDGETLVPPHQQTSI